MGNGNIIEQGNHKQLLGKKGAYSELYHSHKACVKKHQSKLKKNDGGFVKQNRRFGQSRINLFYN